MKVSFEGIGEKVITFYNKAQGGAAAGDPVCIAANATVGKASAGVKFFGVAIAAAEDFAAVQTGGFVQLPYTGTAPALGFVSLSADGNGGVKTPGAGDKFGEYLVIDVDTANTLVGIML